MSPEAHVSTMFKLLENEYYALLRVLDLFLRFHLLWINWHLCLSLDIQYGKAIAAANDVDEGKILAADSDLDLDLVSIAESARSAGPWLKRHLPCVYIRRPQVAMLLFRAKEYHFKAVSKWCTARRG
ncbi:hypothetical protein GGH13_002514 [Coemansia sp. S155-1]|nr:hypothetical protein LPJ71_003695 [Coemansia sp. S17]KAJ2072695.1 hypothetical protein GGH13_002514 [Coemansia sp. S155-1]